jgi:hypothetical protein
MKVLGVSSPPTDANCIGLTRPPFVANVDIVAASSEAVTCISAQGDIERTGCVAAHRPLTGGCVVAPGCVV